MTEIYLDNSTTTRPSEHALSQMMPYFTEKWGSPSAPHRHGQQLFPAIAESYSSIYELLGAKKEDTVIMTSSGAEAVNHAFMSTYYEITKQKGKNQFVTSSIDEAPAIMALERLERMGCVTKMVDVNDKGQVTAEAIGDVITPRTAMVSLSWGNGLTGVVHPVHEIASLCRERGILFHLDATHVLGKLYFDFNDAGAHMVTFNGDHLHAPQGTGGLWIQHGVPCSPLILGGQEQAGLRAGTVNVPGLVGLGVAAKEALECRNLLCTEVARLRSKLEAGIVEKLPEAVCFFQEQKRLPHCTAIGFPHVANEALLFLLNRKGVYAGMGGGSFQQIGLLLMTAGVEESLAHSSLSFSLSRETTEEEIDRAIDIIVESAKFLSQASLHIRKSEHGI
ncbi:MAG: cysteine desulfurase family protein [Waddliaceae bacterium]